MTASGALRAIARELHARLDRVQDLQERLRRAGVRERARLSRLEAGQAAPGSHSPS